jgi:cob(I)alamin adenosyltransferase
MKIYTKRGDTGMTDLFGGDRVKKSSSRVKAFGDVDAANAAIGLAHSCEGLDDLCRSHLLRIMKLLFCLGAEIATAQKEQAKALLDRQLKNLVQDAHTHSLEQAIDEMETKLLPLKSFILPTGSPASAHLHVARTMVRKAEIALIELVDDGEAVRPEVIKFMNRLSDLLFVMARLANRLAARGEIVWSGQIPD